jgi:hypothetical protein
VVRHPTSAPAITAEMVCALSITRAYMVSATIIESNSPSQRL